LKQSITTLLRRQLSSKSHQLTKGTTTKTSKRINQKQSTKKKTTQAAQQVSIAGVFICVSMSVDTRGT